MPPGPVLSQRDQALGALKALASSAWTGERVAGYGVGEGVIASESSFTSSYHPHSCRDGGLPSRALRF